MFDNIIDKLDSYKNVFIKNELDTIKLQLKLDFHSKIEELEKGFSKKLSEAKKTCEKAIINLKSSFQEENKNLKKLIKVSN